MKKVAKIGLPALLAFCLICAVILAGCTPENTHKGVKTVEIANAEEFKTISNNLGADYDGYTYVLKKDIDLTGENWEPIGKSVTESFQSKLDGNDKTIKIKIGRKEIVSADSDSSSREATSYFGLFGCVSGATVKNLKLDIEIDSNVDSDYTYIGGVAAYVHGSTVIENVEVNGSVVTDIHLRRDDKKENEYKEDMYAYAGGAIGYSVGNLTMKNVQANVDFEIREQTTPIFDRYYFAGLYLGGIAGLVRADDNSKSSFISSIQNAGYEGDIVCYGARAQVGGAFGAIYNASVLDTNVRPGKITTHSKMRLNVGGIAGLADSVQFLGGSVNVTATAAPAESDAEADCMNIYVHHDEGEYTANAGGAVGYADNGTVIKNVAVVADIVSYRAVEYGGGIAGVLSDSTIEDSTAAGAFTSKTIDDRIINSGEVYVIDADSAAAANGLGIKKGHGDECFGMYFGGIVGKLYGGAVIKRVDVDFIAFQGAVGKAFDKADIETVKDAEGNETTIIKDPIKGTVEKTTVVYVSDKIGAAFPISGEQSLDNGYGSAKTPADPGEDPADN